MNLIKKLFKRRFGLEDLVLLILILPAIYFTYKGINFDSGFLAVYLTYISKPLAGIFILKVILQNIFRKLK